MAVTGKVLEIHRKSQTSEASSPRTSYPGRESRISLNTQADKMLRKEKS